MSNVQGVVAPIYVTPADWFDASITLDGALPVILRTGTYVPDQATLDSIVDNAVANNIALVYLKIPPMGFTSDGRINNPQAYYPTPALLAEMVASTVGITVDAQAAANASASSAANAAASAASMVGTTDGAMAPVLENPASASSVALSATYVSRYTTIDLVKDYSADNTGTTSLATALQNAVAAANLAGGYRRIILPPGTYNGTAGSTAVITTPGVFIVGSGRGITTVNVNASQLVAWDKNASGGGWSDTTFASPSTPATSQVLFGIGTASTQLFERIAVANVSGIAKLGYATPVATTTSALYITTSSPLSTGSPITSIPINNSPVAVANGQTITISSGANSQSFTLTAAINIGDPTASVSSLTPNFAYPSGSTILGPITTIPVSATSAAMASGSTFVIGTQLFTLSGAAALGATSLSINATAPVTAIASGATVSSSGLASSPTFVDITGYTNNLSGSVVFDCISGSVLIGTRVNVYANCGFPTDNSSPHPANATIGVRFGNGGFWDTILLTDFVLNRYNQDLVVAPTSGCHVSNAWFKGLVCDYAKTNGILLQPQAGGSIWSMYFWGGWGVATDAYSIQTDALLGPITHVRFTDVVGRQGGKNNWRFTGNPSGSAVLTDVVLTECHGLGANRLAPTNTGSDQDDLVILAPGVKVIGGMYGENGQPYTGITGNQGRYGINIAPNLPSWEVLDTTTDGTSEGIIVNASSSGSRRRLLRGNKKLSGALVAYAGTATVSTPTSGATNNYLGDSQATYYISGGTCTLIQHNGFNVGTTGPASLTLRPGDTWEVTYSVAPTIVSVTHP